MQSVLPWLLAACLAASAQTVTFDRQAEGPPGKHWTVAMTHEGGAPKWEIVLDPSAPSQPKALAQTSSDGTSGRFPLAIFRRANVTNGSVRVRFKPVAGGRDQAAGIVWRYRDPENYYIVRANALEDNVVLYKVENGRRTALAPKGTPPETYGVKHTVPKQNWSTLQVDFDGPRFTVLFDGTKIMEVEDESLQAAGRTGLWTKADSVTHFDDFQVRKKR